jgi:GTP-binding protein
VIVHGTQVDKLPQAYTKYLTNVFRKAFKWIGTPVTVEYKVTSNPFEGRKNKLSERIKRKDGEPIAAKKKKKRTQKRRT